MKLITGLMAKKLNRQEGYGRTGKRLSKFQKNYLGKLEKCLENSGLEENLAFEIANTLVRMRIGSLERLLDEGYITNDPKRLVERIKRELNRYQQNGFTKKQTRAMITRLFSWQRMQKLLNSGLKKDDTTQIVIKQSNPEEWWKKAEPIRNELETDGLSRNDATRVVITHANPKQWWGKAKLIRDELMTHGLSKYNATRVILSRSNPKRWWEKAEPLIKVLQKKPFQFGLLEAIGFVIDYKESKIEEFLKSMGNRRTK